MLNYELAKQLKEAGFPQNSLFSFRDCKKYGRVVEVQFTDEAVANL